MTTNMYQMSVDPLVRLLNNLKHILETGAAHAEAHEYEGERLTELRLYPDMLPLRYQVYIACDIAKFAVKRLSDVEAPKFEDDQTTFPDLIERLEKTLAFIESVSEDQINGTEEKMVELKMRSGPVSFLGRDYVQKFVIPNVTFHVATAYNILRTNGVVLGKRDFIGEY